MAATLVQLTLLMMTVIQLTSSWPGGGGGDSDKQFLLHTQLLPIALSNLVTSTAKLHIAVGHLTTAVSQLQRDVTELKTEGRARGKLCYFGSKYNFNVNFNVKLVRRL